MRLDHEIRMRWWDGEMRSNHEMISWNKIMKWDGEMRWWDKIMSLWPSGSDSRLGRNRLWVRFLEVSDIYPMFKEPMITQVPSGFSGYIWLDTKIALKHEIIRWRPASHLSANFSAIFRLPNAPMNFSGFETLSLLNNASSENRHFAHKSHFFHQVSASFIWSFFLEQMAPAHSHWNTEDRSDRVGTYYRGTAAR